MKTPTSRIHSDATAAGFTVLMAFLFAATSPALAQNANSQAKMSQMLSQFEQGKRSTFAGGGGGRMGSASGMPGYANMMGGRRPSNMGGYAGMNRGGSSQMLQMMRQKMARMQSGGGGGNSLMQLMQKRSSGAPNMMPGMGGGPGQTMGMQSGLFAKMMQQDAAFNKNMQRNQMSQGMGMPGGMMGMRRPGMGMSNRGMGLSGMGMGNAMNMGGGSILGRMQQRPSAAQAGSPFAPKSAAPAKKSNTLTDLEKQMESQYGK